ncbi:hypothetical protein N7520_010106, partial [Penicillium odoratum]|uniref:uncharacterized protein n=1 Tax=Penicillium odoratum TaxID=1167516 RepID=UPI002549B70A
NEGCHWKPNPCYTGPKLDEPDKPPYQCPSNSTIWELISQSPEIRRLADVLGRASVLVNLLSSTKHKFTQFALTNRALDRLQDRHQLLSMDAMLHYHVVLGQYSLEDLKTFDHQTLPTALNISLPGNANDKKHKNKHKDKDKDRDHKKIPQRLRVDTVRHSILLNGKTGIIESNIVAKHGIIHHIHIPLFPPPTTKAIISVLLEQFSTFALALSHTGLDSHLDATNRTSGTTLAPTNETFRALGSLVNEFLFSPQSEECLRSLLKYHLVLGKTIYSDVVYGKEVEELDLERRLGKADYVTVDLLWKDSSVDFRVNGFWEPMTVDVLASDGVIHVLERVLIPPKIVGKGIGDEVTVEILREHLKTVGMEL